MRIVRFLVLTSTLLVLVASNVKADPITFVHQGAGSGSIGGTPFVNASFTIVALGDTSTRSSFGNAYFIDHSSASITIDGVGTFNFSSGTRTFVNSVVGVVGFSRAGWDGIDLFTGPGDPACATWDMFSSIGPITGVGNLWWWAVPQAGVFASTGQLMFNDGSGPARFTATVGSVPEPTSLTLLGLGIGAALARRLRRRNRSRMNHSCLSLTN